MDSSKHLLLIGLKKSDHTSHGADETEGASTASPGNEAIDEMFRELKAGNHDGAREAFRSAVRICRMEDETTENKEEAGY